MTVQAIGISGSPSSRGTTDRLIGRILEASGLDSELVRLWDMRVEPCSACLACAGSNICSAYDDDWLELAVKLLQADALVLGGWAPFNILDARTKTVIERSFSLRHSMMLLAGTVGVGVVAGTVDPRPVADDVLAWFETEGLVPLGKVTPAGIDPCWSCGLGEACTVGGTIPLVRGEYELFWYPHKERLPRPDEFEITPEVMPPPLEEQPEVLAQAERLGRELGEAVQRRREERWETVERLLPGAADLPPATLLRALLEAKGERAVGGEGELMGLLGRAEEQTCARQARAAVVTLLELGRRLLWQPQVEDEALRDLLVAKTRRAIIDLYEEAAC